MRVRASLGTLAVLGLINVELVEKPTTAYILLHSEGGCMGECVFCPQSRLSKSDKALVARVSWPEVEIRSLLNNMKRNSTLRRICIQTVIKDGFQNDVLGILNSIREEGIRKPISLSTTPVSKEYLLQFKDLGVDAVGVGFDAATPELFAIVRKPYSWEYYLKFLKESLDVFGHNNVYIHLIYGLGESEVGFFNSMKYFKDLGVKVSLFSFTPVRGTLAEDWRRPSIVGYRKMQILKYLMDLGVKVDDYVKIEGDRLILSRELLMEILDNISRFYDAFITSGCPNCNRPFYNEGVRGPYYNYPSRHFLLNNKERLVNELMELLRECG